MNANELKVLEEEFRQLRILKMKHDNANKKAEKEDTYFEIKVKVSELFKKFKLSEYDFSFTTSSSMYDLEHMFYDLNNIIEKIKISLNEQI